ncbi:hypothetical protein CRE_03341 [Caenorhabditis remanei]|uniref:Tyrosine-protein phosphatase domain-containing protein n=1 Tax=Caenorhabditis remanei TaxID=31234 RepID=E3MYK7_CAERE|nr:hypothetical protein CRE_03341 [Caenorhabditis remanei]
MRFNLLFILFVCHCITVSNCYDTLPDFPIVRPSGQWTRYYPTTPSMHRFTYNTRTRSNTPHSEKPVQTTLTTPFVTSPLYPDYDKPIHPSFQTVFAKLSHIARLANAIQLQSEIMEQDDVDSSINRLLNNNGTRSIQTLNVTQLKEFRTDFERDINSIETTYETKDAEMVIKTCEKIRFDTIDVSYDFPNRTSFYKSLDDFYVNFKPEVVTKAFRPVQFYSTCVGEIKKMSPSCSEKISYIIIITNNIQQIRVSVYLSPIITPSDQKKKRILIPRFFERCEKRRRRCNTYKGGVEKEVQSPLGDVNRLVLSYSKKLSKNVFLFQGPMNASETHDDTRIDLLALIFKDEVECVVMLGSTRLPGGWSLIDGLYFMENERGSMEIGPYTVETVNSEPLVVEGEPGENVTCRKLKITNRKKKVSRELQHFQYATWNDNDIPPGGWETAYRVMRMVTGSKKPIIVHCTKGIGRTMCFIGLEYTSQLLVAHENWSFEEVFKKLIEKRYCSFQNTRQIGWLHVGMVYFITRKYNLDMYMVREMEKVFKEMIINKTGVSKDGKF